MLNILLFCNVKHKTYFLHTKTVLQSTLDIGLFARILHFSCYDAENRMCYNFLETKKAVQFLRKQNETMPEQKNKLYSSSKRKTCLKQLCY